MAKAARAAVNPFENETEVLTDEAAEAQEMAEHAAEPAEQAPPEPAPAPEPEAAKGEEKVIGPVPYDRFKEVNERRAAAEKERDELREKWARMDERTRQINEAREAAQQQAQEAQRAAERPDANIDPVGAKLWDLEERDRKREQELSAAQQRLQELQGGFQQNQQLQAFTNYVTYDVQRYKAQHPEYDEAATFAAQKRQEAWMAAGATPEVARNIVQRESEALANLAMQNGRSVAEAVHMLAKQWGFQPQAPANGNGQRPAQPSANQARLDQVQRAQSHQGIGHIPGGGNEATTSYKNYTPAQIAEMSEAEFSRIKANPRAWAELQYAMGVAEGIDPNDMGRI